MLVNAILKNAKRGIIPRLLIAASAAGYYGFSKSYAQAQSSPLYSEEHPPSTHKDDFLANLCVRWEQELQPLQELAMQVVILRFAHVLCPLNQSGFLRSLLTQSKRYAIAFDWPQEAILSSTSIKKIGKNKILDYPQSSQYSWIHIDDLVAIIKMFIQPKNNLQKSLRVYNTATPYPTCHRQIYNLYNKQLSVLSLKKPLLYKITGSMRALFLADQKLDVSKLLATGYTFRYAKIQQALDHLISVS